MNTTAEKRQSLAATTEADLDSDLIAIVAALHSRTEELEEKLSKEEASHSSTIDQRDYAESMADKLAQAISERFRVEVGEHSNMECPWANALSVLNGEYETDSDQDREVELLQVKLAERDERAEVEEALLYLDDFVARCNGDDRGSCSAVKTLRAALERKP
ncbi:hypothetical protein RZO07_10135 [Pseudomonas protegens]|uniref:hypothetical protein n=1 Tax=Pseudomonas protegens TaxID=380021 RepID=UPI002936FD2D|nr:hypothetical protein [Pseudomonas protegens]WOE81560.1 hypothetical protein RZO07_10135 [Pseudomonas protegens]